MSKRKEDKKGRRPSEKTLEALRKNNLKSRTPEERHEIAMKGVEARRKKKEQTMALQSCMKQLLSLKVKSEKQKQILKAFGFEDEELTNRTILMVALFKKGLTGDVGAIKEITEMMEELDMVNDGKTVSGRTININLLPTGNTYKQTEEDEQNIWKVENGIAEEKDSDLWETDPTDENWGNDVYDGK